MDVDSVAVIFTNKMGKEELSKTIEIGNGVNNNIKGLQIR